MHDYKDDTTLETEARSGVCATTDELVIQEDGTANLPVAFFMLFGPEGTCWIAENRTPVRIRFLNGNPLDLRVENLRIEHRD